MAFKDGKQIAATVRCSDLCARTAAHWAALPACCLAGLSLRTVPPRGSPPPARVPSCLNVRCLNFGHLYADEGFPGPHVPLATTVSLVSI